MDDVEASVDRIAGESAFSGVVRIDRGEDTEFVRAYGLAHRTFRIRNEIDTRFGIASGTKGLTALTVMSLIEDGVLEEATCARAFLGDDLPLVGEDVTVEHLLAHRSGIGDYYNEEEDRPVTDHILPVPVHELATTEEYLRVLDGHPPKFAAGTRFAYSNSGYVLLALICERSTGAPFDELVMQHVCTPAGMRDTGFLRSDELPPTAATGYLDTRSPRTNVLHLPVRGSGDGGAYSTAADISALWAAMFEGRIVPAHRVADMVRPHSDAGSMRYGLGFWLDASSDAVILEGSDAGVSFRSIHLPGDSVTATVISNVTDGAWPIARFLRDVIRP